MKRENLDWLLGRQGGAREMGETGLLGWLVAFSFVAGLVLILSWLAHS